ncbi:unnamed protein product [Porites lobata]|uniref:Reverse transcriptase domain-containing protein n=1 Tax=Porites lobata TaxID=104759 RepID=A0ABN8QSW5_9CNID|nr:unnamed protein product [Porites lobata]
MTDALEDHQGTVSIGGRTITNLLFADGIDGLAGKEEELASLVDRLDKTSAAFGLEISAEKTKLMTNNANGISIDIRIHGEKLDEVDSFKVTAEILKKLQATEMRCFRKLLGFSYRDHITNDAVRDRIRQAIAPCDDILTMVKKRKLKWFGHVSRRFYKEHCKEGEEGADKRSVGKTTSLNGQG